MATNYNPRLVTDGLVLCLDAGNTKSYPGSGTTWTDLSGNGNTGTLVNGVGYNSGNGGSLSFDGVNDYVSFSSSTSVQFLNRSPYTLEVWMYPTSNPLGSQTYTGIFNREDSSVGSRDGYNLWLHPIDANTLRLSSERFTTGTAVNTFKNYNNSELLNIWHYVVVTYDGTTIKLYKNTQEISTNTSTGNITNTSKTLEIGRRGGGSYFNGRLTGQKIYNKALTASEIQQNFNATRSRYSI